MAGMLPPIEPVRPYQDRQLDTTDSFCCDVPQHIQQAQLMQITLDDGALADAPVPTSLADLTYGGQNPYNRAVKD